MTHFKYEGEVYDLENLADFLDEHVSDDDFDEHVNYESDLIEVLGHDFDASEVLRQMDEGAYYNEKREWCERLAEENSHNIEANYSIGELYSFDNVCISITICDEDGNEEEVPKVPVPNYTFTELPTITPLEGRKYLIQGFVDENGNKATVTISRAELITINNAILNL